jgi:hypothetical protein
MSSPEHLPKDPGRKSLPLVRGTADSPMTRKEVEVKCQDLFPDVLGKERTASLIATVWALEKVQSMRELRPLLSA